MNHALIVDSDGVAAKALAALLVNEGFTVAVVQSLRDAQRQKILQAPDLLMLDPHLEDGNGMDLFDDPDLVARAEIVLLTDSTRPKPPFQATPVPGANGLVKPIDAQQLQDMLARVMRPGAPGSDLATAQREWDASGGFGKLRGRSGAMRAVYEQLARVAATSVSVFIAGESGTGKEVVAQTVHDLSRRSKRPFLAVNCGAISPNLIESEIFGHEKGSFTGADRQHQGFFERAHGGTLFLDEITEMPPELQVKLLRVLETGLFMRVGSTQTQETDVRVIAATNRPPELALTQGKLREDLYYRLNVFPIELPPLRERAEDIVLLAEHFLAEVCAREREQKTFTPAALQRLTAYRWPGNVRELRNVVQRAFVMAAGPVIGDDWLPRSASAAAARPAAVAEADSIALQLGTSLAEAERQLILATLSHFDHQRERTAAVLGVSLKTLYNRLKEYHSDSAAGELSTR